MDMIKNSTLRRSDRCVEWWKMILLSVTIALFVVLIVLAATVAVRADGNVGEDDYRIGVDPTPPGTYHRLYVPVLMEGNRTQVDASFVLKTAGSGSPRFTVKFLDDRNFELRRTGTTHYEWFTTGSTVGPTTTFTTSFNMSLEQGWPNGVYWFVVDKETEGNDWCFITWSVSFVTDEVGNGALVELRFEGVEASVAKVTRDVELVDARAAALEADLAELRADLGAEVMLLKYLIETVNFTQGVALRAAVAALEADLEGGLGALNTSLSAILEGVRSEAYNETYALARALEGLMLQAQADFSDLSSRINATAARSNAFEAENEALRELLEALEGRLEVLEGNVTALGDKEAAAPDLPSVVPIILLLLVGGFVGFFVTMMATSPFRKGKKEG